MRTFFATSAIALGLTACATQAPQCWNGDAGKFEDVGAKASISGVAVVCEKTSDGKNAQWMGAKK